MNARKALQTARWRSKSIGMTWTEAFIEQFLYHAIPDAGKGAAFCAKLGVNQTERRPAGRSSVPELQEKINSMNCLAKFCFLIFGETTQ